MTKKQILRCVIFLLIAAVMLFALCDMFEMENNTNASQRFYTYRTMKKDTVDTIFLGTSGIDRYWIPSQAYEANGMTSYPLATDAMPSWLYIDAIEEALSHHKAKLIVLDIRPFTQINDDASVMDVRARRVLDTMAPLSVNRVKAAFTTMKTVRQVDETAPRFDISYLLSFVRYHQMWEEDDYNLDAHLGNETHPFAGYFVSNKYTLRTRPLKAFTYDPQPTAELDPISEQALYDVIDYIKENELNVLFLDTPQRRSKKEMALANTVYRILEEEGMNYLHYYSTESDTNFSIALDPETDFYNSGHVNYYGAVKFTEALGTYLDTEYDLPDRRTDEKVSKDWDGIHDALLERIEEIKAK